MTNDASETKSKILEAGRVLFATKGFEGTSIREIAAAAGVNLAAINYHFSSKENLLQEVLRIGYQECSVEIEDFYRRDQSSLEETLVTLYHYFLARSHDLMAHFKIMISSQLGHKIIAHGTPDEGWGPPGGRIIIEAIQKEVDGSINEEDFHWALKCLFSHVVHMCLLSNSCFQESDNIPYSSPRDIEAGIRRLSRLVVRELKENSKTK